jgi:GxxExxY protein
MMLNRATSKLSSSVEDIVHAAIGCAMTVHRHLGPGFKETIYQQAYRLELNDAGLSFECEKPILVPYRTWLIPGQRIDLIVQNVVLVELKAIPKLRKVHHRQVVAYLRATRLEIGLLMNFNSVLLKDGLKRIVL